MGSGDRHSQALMGGQLGRNLCHVHGRHDSWRRKSAGSHGRRRTPQGWKEGWAGRQAAEG